MEKQEEKIEVFSTETGNVLFTAWKGSYQGVQGITRYTLRCQKARAKWYNYFYNYYHVSEESRDKAFNELVNNFRNHEARKLAERKARKEFKHSLKVGNVLSSSWGYEQTNVDFYQVVDTKGKSVVLRKIAGQHVRDTGWAQGYIKPAKNKFVGEPFTKRVSEGNYVNLTSYSGASLTSEDKEHFTSSYA